MVLRPEGSVAGEEWGVKRVEQQLPDFRITGSVPPKVLPEAHRFAPRIRSPRSRKLPCFRDDIPTIITCCTTCVGPTSPAKHHVMISKEQDDAILVDYKVYVWDALARKT